MPLPLNAEQHRHFSDHGWVIVPEVFDAEACARFRALLDRVARTRVHSGTFSDGPATVLMDNLTLFDDAFVEVLTLPGLLPSCRRLMGCDLRLTGTSAHIRQPHPERATAAPALRDPRSWGWHRGIRPRWCNAPDEHDPTLLASCWLNVVSYFTPVHEGNGATAVLDGSHRAEGTWQELLGRLPLLQPAVPAGGMLIFTEALYHSAVPILSETVRYNMYYEFVPPWWASHPWWEMPETVLRHFRDEELRRVLGPPRFRGQIEQPAVPAP